MNECSNCGDQTRIGEDCLACGVYLCIPCAEDHVCTPPSQYAEKTKKWESLSEEYSDY